MIGQALQAAQRPTDSSDHAVGIAARPLKFASGKVATTFHRIAPDCFGLHRIVTWLLDDPPKWWTWLRLGQNGIQEVTGSIPVSSTPNYPPDSRIFILAPTCFLCIAFVGVALAWLRTPTPFQRILTASWRGCLYRTSLSSQPETRSSCIG